MSRYRIYFHSAEAGRYYLSPEFEVNGETAGSDAPSARTEPVQWESVLEQFAGVRNTYGFFRRVSEVMDRYHLKTPLPLPGVRIEIAHSYEELPQADRVYGVDPEGKVFFDGEKSSSDRSMR